MLNRDKLNFWVRIVAISLAAIFILSSVFLGIGTEVSYNLFDLIGGRNEQQTAQSDTGTQEQIQNAEQNLRENPKDADAIQSLAVLYIQNNRLDEAEQVLEEGRETAPEDPEVALLLGQVYAQQAEYASGGNGRSSTRTPAMRLPPRRGRTPRTRMRTTTRARPTSRPGSLPRRSSTTTATSTVRPTASRPARSKTGSRPSSKAGQPRAVREVVLDLRDPRGGCRAYNRYETRETIR